MPCGAEVREKETADAGGLSEHLLWIADERVRAAGKRTIGEKRIVFFGRNIPWYSICMDLHLLPPLFTPTHKSSVRGTIYPIRVRNILIIFYLYSIDSSNKMWSFTKNAFHCMYHLVHVWNGSIYMMILFF